MHCNGNSSEQSSPERKWKKRVVLAGWVMVILMGSAIAYIASKNDDIGATVLKNVVYFGDTFGIPKDNAYFERLDAWLRSAIAEKKPITAQFLADRLMAATAESFGDASPQSDRACVLASAAYAIQDSSAARSFYMRGARNLAKSSWQLHSQGKGDEASGIAQFLVENASPEIQRDNKFYNRAIIELALCEQESGNMDAGQATLKRELDAEIERHDRDVETTRFYLGCMYCSNKPTEAVELLQHCLKQSETADIAVDIDEIKKQLQTAQLLCKNIPAAQTSGSPAPK